MKYIVSFILPLAVLMMFTSNCRTNSDTNFKDDKKISSPQINAVQIQPLKKETFHKQIITNGKVYAAQKADLTFAASGTIKEIYTSNGERLEKGDTIAILDRKDLLLSLASAKAVLDKARLDYYDMLAGLGFSIKDTSSISQDILSMAKIRSGYTSAENNLQRIVYDYNSSILCAPFHGVIANITSHSNEQTSAECFCTLIDDSLYNVKFHIMESEYGFVSKNQKVRITSFAAPDVIHTGTIESINPAIDKNGQIEICASTTKSDNLLDGMNVRIIIEKSIPNQLVIPRSALVIRDGFDVIFTYTPDGIAHWIYVDIIDKNSESAIVKANTERGTPLREGDNIIISGNLNLADGSKVTVL